LWFQSRIDFRWGDVWQGAFQAERNENRAIPVLYQGKILVIPKVEDSGIVYAALRQSTGITPEEEEEQNPGTV
jgi:hypothetical protein